MSENVINCSQCSAPIDFRPGDAVAYCIYCDGVTKLREIKENEKKYMLEATFKREHVRKLLVGDFLKIPGVTDSLADDLQITNARLVYLPYYVGKVHGNVKWAGLGRQAQYSFPFKGAYRNISFFTAPESGEFDDQMIVTNYAGTQEYGKLANYKLSSTGKKYFNLGEIKQNGGEIIDESYDENAARDLSLRAIADKHNRLLQEEVNQVTQRTDDYRVDELQLVFVPFWFLEWRFPGNDKIQYTIIDAASGQTIEMDTPRPRKFWLFAIFTTILFFFIGLLPIILSYLGLIDEPGPQMYITLAIGCGLGIQTIILSRPKKFVETAN